MVSNLEKEKLITIVYQSQSGEEYIITGNRLSLNFNENVIRLGNKYLPRKFVKRITYGDSSEEIKLERRFRNIL